MTSREANAGSLAAASVVVSKQVPMRDPLLAGLPARFRPSSLGDLSRLFSQDDSSPAHRLARLSAAALVCSVNKKDTTQAAKLLRNDERGVLDDLRRLYDKPPNKVTDRSCPHCRVFLSTLYRDRDRWRNFPPIAVVNHQARVEISFDPESNVSEAKIDKFQVIVPKEVAKRMISLAHPLRWDKTEGSLFRRSDPVEADGSEGEFFGKDRADVESMWEKRAHDDEAFIFEDVGWPVNEQLSADSENVIRISNFQRAENDNGYSLEYDYALERCIRTNFGIAWERSGLDIDGGRFSASAVPLDTLVGMAVASSTQGSVNESLCKLKRRDVLALEAQQNPNLYETLALGWDAPDALCDPERPDFFLPAILAEKLGRVAAGFRTEWKEFAPFYLLEVSASKEIHFTIPEVSPIDLWQNLTYTAPAILFAFLNRSVCHAPHLLLEGLERESFHGGV